MSGQQLGRRDKRSFQEGEKGRGGMYALERDTETQRKQDVWYAMA